MKATLTPSLILSAAVLGTLAFQAGKEAVPCRDAALLDLIKQNPVKEMGASLGLIKAWAKAWHDANLAAAV